MTEAERLQKRCHEIEKRIRKLHRIEGKLKKERESLIWQMSAYSKIEGKRV